MEYLGDVYYIDTYENAVYSILDDSKVGFVQIESAITRIFGIDEDWGHVIVFNWLLFNGVNLVRKNWNKTYMVHNKGSYSSYETTLTEDIDFEYKMVYE